MKDAVIESNVMAGIITPEKKIDKNLQGAVVLDLVFKTFDKNGKQTSEHFEQGHSFLANFIKMLYCVMMYHHAPYADGSALSLVDTDGTSRSGSSSYAISGMSTGTFFKANASSGDTTYGILVGTDNGAVLAKDINNYQLGAKIAHGSGAGQISYGDHSIVPVTHDGSSYSFAGITRSFSNISGGSIDVYEIGLATYLSYWDTNTNRRMLLSRDILGTPVTVPNAESLTASIRVKCYC